MNIRKEIIIGLIMSTVSLWGVDNVCMEKLDKYFFKTLDPAAMPTEYDAALKKNDKKAALRAAVKYFRNRPRPPFFNDIKSRKFDSKIAQLAVKGNITVVGVTHQFPGGRVDFTFNPTVNTPFYNPEWQWQLNRMYFWTDMALSYYLTPDEKIARAFAQQLFDWVTKMPCPQKNWRSANSAWRTIETGLRLMTSWQIAFEVFRKSPSLPDETLALMLASMYEQALHSIDHHTDHNWLMMEANGAYIFAALFPEFRGTTQLRQKAVSLLAGELKGQILPDGFHNELSPDYHSVVFTCASMMFKNAHLSGRANELPPYFGKLLEAAAEAAVNMMTPAFTQPRTNDSYTMETPKLLARCAEYFPHRKDFQWALTRGAEGVPPAGKTASRFLPWAGFAAMRSNWTKDAAYLAFDVGPLGVAHVHQDKLNINIYKGGEELLYDDGGGQYDRSVYRAYGKSSAAHNVILVDGMGQSREEPPVVKEAIDAGFFTDSKFDYAHGTYDDVFGPKKQKSASHKREVLFVKPDFFAVVDTLKSSDGKPHDYTMLLHLDTLKVKTSKQTVHGVLSGKYDLYALLLTDDISVKVESGQNDPISGWYVGRNDKKLHPASTVKITAAQKKDHRFLTLFFPLKKGAALPKAQKLANGRWQVTFNGSTYQLYLDDLQKNFRK